MNPSGNTILITGGASGIGFALAEEFAKMGNKIIICGRREERLNEAKGRIKGLEAMKCDISKADERVKLFQWATSNFSSINVLVNNAGIQRPADLTRGDFAEEEIATNLVAPMHMCSLFVPFFMKSGNESAIVNISSGLAFVPLARFPVYSATKAAMHSYCTSLRHQTKATNVKVFEVIPPTVDTELKGEMRERIPLERRGIKPEEVAKASVDALKSDTYEVAIGMAKDLMKGSREDPDGAFSRMNNG